MINIVQRDQVYLCLHFNRVNIVIKPTKITNIDIDFQNQILLRNASDIISQAFQV